VFEGMRLEQARLAYRMLGDEPSAVALGAMARVLRRVKGAEPTADEVVTATRTYCESEEG